MKKISKDQKGTAKIKENPNNAGLPRPLEGLEVFTKPPAAFTQALAREIVKNLTNLGQLTTRPFRKKESGEKKNEQIGENPVLVDTSVLIDGRILPIVNSGFFAGTILVPKFVLEEIQHVADSADMIRRSKGRRGLDIVNKLKGQKPNSLVKTKVIDQDVPEVMEVDHKLVALAKRWKGRLLTLDFNLAHLARAQGVKVVNINDMAQALKIALLPGEEMMLKITHEGRDREQGVGYLTDGTMVVVDHAKTSVGSEVTVVVTKIHQTPAGQLFFARLK